MTFYTDILARAAIRASQHFGRKITVESLRDRSKAKSVTHPRFYAIAYMHAIGRFSLPQIARAFGFSDHTTVIHALRRAHGYDKKPVTTDRFNNGKWAKLEPLWKSEQFENLVFMDGYTDRSVTSPNYETLMLIGERNLRRLSQSIEQPLSSQTNSMEAA